MSKTFLSILAVPNKTDFCTNPILNLILRMSIVIIIIISIIIGAIGAMGSSCNSLLSLLNDLHFDKTIQKRIIMKTMSISLRSSYYIFCHRNKPWTNPELLTI